MTHDPTAHEPEVPAWLAAQAEALGLSALGVADARAPWTSGARLAAFIDAGRHGDMTWMADTLARRSHPTAMWADARSAVVVGLSYAPRTDPLMALEDRRTGAVSVYAHGADYHDLLKRRLKALAREIAAHTQDEVKVFVDTAPLMEKPLAARAGVGWQGKHTNLVSRAHGSWLFLGVVLTAAELAPSAPEVDHCGSCRACLDVCPTDAFPAPSQLDARRCIAYLTIEHAGPIPRPLRAAMGNRIYGCDDCLAVCPWNKFAVASREAALAARPHLRGARLVDLAALTDADFREVFAGSPIKRTGRDRVVRNVLIALGNSGEASPPVLDAVTAALDDGAPVVRGAAVWAFWRLAPAPVYAAAAETRLEAEHDPEVIAEWRAGLALAPTALAGDDPPTGASPSA